MTFPRRMNVEVARLRIAKTVLEECRNRPLVSVRHENQYQHFRFSFIVGEADLDIFPSGQAIHELRIGLQYLELHLDRDTSINKIAEQRQNLRAPDIPPLLRPRDPLPLSRHQQGREVVGGNFALVIIDVLIALLRLPSLNRIGE